MDCLPSDDILAIVVPFIVYWVYSGIYMFFTPLEKFRLHSRKEEDMKNLVPKLHVVKMVLVQQLLQSSVAFAVYKLSEDYNSRINDNRGQPSFPVMGRQFVVAMLIVDAWNYFWHRYMHHNKFLYKHIHSWHHRLVVPYSFGSQYNHPIEGLLLDTVGGAFAFVISGMTTRTSIYFFTFATVKGIDDHCGLCLPGNLFHAFFANNSAYHDIHHQLYGNKYNFSQPFFNIWDRMLGTYMPYKLVKREGGGLESRPAND